MNILSILMGTLLLTTQAAPIPVFNPNGVWEAATGSKYTFQLSGSNLKVQIVEGSNPRFLTYELDLKSTAENIYKGTGFFVAKLQNGKQCRFETDWEISIISDKQLLGSAATVTPNPDTCEAKEKGRARLDLKKK